MQARGRSTEGTTGEKLAQARTAMLDEWLGQLGVSRPSWEREVNANLTIQGWIVRGRVVVIQRLGPNGEDGWNIFTDCNSNSTVDSIEDAERRIGMRAPAPASAVVWAEPSDSYLSMKAIEVLEALGRPVTREQFAAVRGVIRSVMDDCVKGVVR